MYNNTTVDYPNLPSPESSEPDNSLCQSFPGLASSSASLVRGIYVYPDSCDLETGYIVLVQDNCVSVWWRESGEAKEWSLVDHFIDEEPTDVKCSTLETDRYIWIGLVYDGIKDLTLTHLRFDKIEKNVKLYLRELFSSTYVSADMINKCQLRQNIIDITCLPHEKSALTVPGPSNTIRLFLYDLQTSQKILLTTLHIRNASSTRLLPVDDWDKALISVFGTRIQIWNAVDRSLINSVIVDKSVLENKICFNVLHDKGLVYLFVQDSQSSAIDVMALNPKTGRYATLMSCNVFESDVTNPVKISKIKRKGNQLLLITDNSVVIYDLATNKSVLNCGQGSIADSSIGFVKDKAVIFAATLNGKIINLLNS